MIDYTCGLLLSSNLPGAYPEKQATIANINTEMLPHAPRYAVEILGRKDRPDEQMRSQSCTCKHYKQKATRDKSREQGQMPNPFLMLLISPGQKQRCCGRPPQGTRPITAESQHTHSHYVVSIDTVVSVGKINRGDGVRAAKGKE